MTQRDIRFDTLSGFIEAVKEAGIRDIAFAVTDEKRSIQKAEDIVEVERVRMAEILAYKNSALYRYTEAGDCFMAAEQILINAGLTVTRRNRNIS